MPKRTRITPRRIGRAVRKTAEVDIEVEVNLEGGPYEISLSASKEELDIGGTHLYEHLLEQVFKHGELGGKVQAQGDRTHHVTEDVGLVLGEAIRNALGDAEGIERMWVSEVPLNGTYAHIRIDFGGRGVAYFDISASVNPEMAGMVQHLFETIAAGGKFEIGCVIGRMPGAPPNAHHEAEAVAKTFARALRHATAITRRELVPPTTKGVL